MAAAAEDYHVTGVRMYSDGLSKDHKQGFFSWLVAVVTLTLYTGWLHIMFGLIIASFFSRAALIILVLLLATLKLPAKPVLWPAFNRLWIFKTWREYFNYSFAFEEVLDHNKRYIFIEFPHGVYPMSPLIAGTLIQTLFDGFNIYSIAATSVFSIPFWRHFIAWIGSVPATSKNFKRLLEKGSVAVIVGGIAEMYMQDARKERVKLLDRKGFVKVALEMGIDGIVPVYHFGNSQILDFGPASLQGLGRKLRTSVGFLYGWMGLPLPRRHPLYMVTGKAIQVPKVDPTDASFDEKVSETHRKVVAELQALYDRHKGEFGWKDRPLSIE